MSKNVVIALLSIVIMAVFIYATPSFAHPGRTASDGCHYCGTNCDKWGVPWNERHCHGAPVVPLPDTSSPKTVVTACLSNFCTLSLTKTSTHMDSLPNIDSTIYSRPYYYSTFSNYDSDTNYQYFSYTAS